MKFLRSVYAFCSSWVGTIVIVLLVIFFVAQAFIIPSRSMVGTLYEGDMLFVKKFSYGIPIPKIPWIELPVMPDFKNNGHLIEGDRPKRGEVVVFIPPHEKNLTMSKGILPLGAMRCYSLMRGFICTLLRAARTKLTSLNITLTP